MSIGLSEHHSSPDGYLPSPLTMLAAMAVRTTSVRFTVAALIAPFYDPLRLAEDLVVLDHLSRGRVDVIVAAGYVRQEFEVFGVPMGERPTRVTEVVTTLKAAFTGEPFEYRGRPLRPRPRRRRPPRGRVLSDPDARRLHRGAEGRALPVRHSPPPLRGPAPRPGLGKPAAVRARGPAGVLLSPKSPPPVGCARAHG